jgi:hypothetical protein
MFVKQVVGPTTVRLGSPDPLTGAPATQFVGAGLVTKSWVGGYVRTRSLLLLTVATVGALPVTACSERSMLPRPDELE